MTEPLAGFQRFHAPLGDGDFTWRVGRHILFGSYRRLVTVDLARWPPVIEHHEDLGLRAVDHDRSRGRWLLQTDDPRDSTAGHALEIRDGPHGPPGARVGAALLAGPAVPLLEAVALFDDAVLAVPSRHGARAPAMFTAPVWVVEGCARPVEDLPAEPPPPAERGEWVEPARGLARLAGGARIVVWDGDGYELVGGRLVRTFALGARSSHWPFTSAPWGDDGLYYLSNRVLFRARRGGAPEPVTTAADNVMSVAPGPAGTLLLHHGQNAASLVVSAVRPDDGTMAGFKRPHFAMERWMHADTPVYSEATGRIYMHALGLATVPAESVLAKLAVPRRARGGGAKREA